MANFVWIVQKKQYAEEFGSSQLMKVFLYESDSAKFYQNNRDHYHDPEECKVFETLVGHEDNRP